MKSQRTTSKLVLFLIALFSLLTVASTSFAETKVGVVDIKKVMETVPDGKKAMKSLQATLKSKQAKLDAAKKEFQAYQEKLSKRSVVKQPTPEEAREYQQKAAELQQMYVKLQQELATAEVEAQAKILKKVQAAAQKVATEKSYDLIVDKSEASVLYANSSLDLTDAVIKAYGK